MKSQDTKMSQRVIKNVLPRLLHAIAYLDESDFEYSVQLLRRVPKKCSEAAMAW